MKEKKEVRISLVDLEKEKMEQKEMIKIAGGKICDCIDGGTESQAKTVITVIQ